MNLVPLSPRPCCCAGNHGKNVLEFAKMNSWLSMNPHEFLLLGGLFTICMRLWLVLHQSFICLVWFVALSCAIYVTSVKEVVADPT